MNNAGVYQFAPLDEITEDQVHRQFNTNVLGLILATQEATRHFGPEGGAVINIGSTVSTITPPTSAIYTATKGAVDAVTRVLAKELGQKKIRVNSSNPGMVEAEGVHAADLWEPIFSNRWNRKRPWAASHSPETAPIAVFLASQDSGWMTGETLLASGGLR
ncbi:MAG: SDR family NAD(P)-dependent oxidoreductase [Bryobacteraceae bacterium]